MKAELSIFIIAAHLTGDFIIQTDKMAAEKLNSHLTRLNHVLTYHTAFLPLIFLLSINEFFIFTLLSFITHFIIDSRRWVSEHDNIPNYCIIVDQIIHLYSLGLILILTETLI